jgi:phosphoenolpyruvate-protein kinase (PTS system EI component)
MILAEFETLNFTFKVVAADRESAANQLAKAWRKHVREYSEADPKYLSERLDEISYFEIRLGDVLLDGEIYLEGKQ